MSDLGPAAPSTTRRAAKSKSFANGKPDSTQDLLRALQAMRSGDFSVRMMGNHLGIEGKIADTFNEIVAANQRMAQQLERVGQVVGREGKTRQRVKFGLASGSWADMEGSVNTLIDDLLWPTREVTRAAAAVAQGKLGGQAIVPGVAGTWKDLTDNVNLLAGNLTTQVRNIAQVTTAVARGDLSRKITVDVKGEVLELKDTINTMVDQLNAFASEVTRVAREVGTEGKLGGQAVVRGVAGTWKDLTDSVNSMASNLTGQVRNIAEVATA